MKKFFNLVLLVGLFISFSATNANSQSVENQTNCQFTGQVAYHIGCFYIGFENFTVNGSSSFPLNIPAGARILASRGYPVVAPNCGYEIGEPMCDPNQSTVDSPTCLSASPCSVYHAHISAPNEITIE